jgi:hypothetical protein
MQLFLLLDFSQSCVRSEGVLLEEYIGKYDFCHYNCHFLLHFWKKLAKNNNVMCKL